MARKYTEEEKLLNLTGEYDEYSSGIPGGPILKIPCVHDPDIPLPDSIAREILNVFGKDIDEWGNVVRGGQG